MKRRKNRIILFVIVCLILLVVGVIIDMEIRNYIEKYDAKVQEENQQRAVEAKNKEAEIDEHRIKKVIDLPSGDLEKMIQYTSDDIVSKCSTTNNIFSICGDTLDDKYGDIYWADGGWDYKYSYFITSDLYNGIDTWVDEVKLYQIILYSRKDDPNEGVLRIVYRLNYNTDFHNLIEPGGYSQVQEYIYTSYYYLLNLSGESALVSDYNEYFVDGGEQADLDYDNWYNKNVNVYRDKWDILDEYNY